MAKKGVQTPLIVIVGATGTGKSQLAVDLATKFHGEIINGDAMQMYDGLPIITNKITIDERRGIPHHLLGIASLDEEPWRVGVFKRKAGSIIKEIHSRGKLPILVGGTHYYTQSLLFQEGLTSEENDDEPANEMSRLEINRRFPILEAPTEQILERLRDVDPAMADWWHPRDRRRIQRSLEIYLMTGKQASKIYQEQNIQVTSESDSLLQSTLIFWLHADKEVLPARLDARVEKMVTAGLIDEVKKLDEFLHEQNLAGKTVDRSSGIWVSIGFKEFGPYLWAIKGGTKSSEEVETILAASIQKTKAATRQYAKRQIKWIRVKLLTALSEARVLEHTYLFDGSNLDDWLSSVKGPAFEIVQRFLSEEDLPAPADISPVAAELLTPKHAVRFQERRASWTKQVCELCGVTSVTEEAWQDHLKSRRHRTVSQKRRKKQEYLQWKAQNNEATSDAENT